MPRVFLITPTRTKRTNGTILTPEMTVTVTTKMHVSTQFYNGAAEVIEAYMEYTASTTKKHVAIKTILRLRRWGELLSTLLSTLLLT